MLELIVYGLDGLLLVVAVYFSYQLRRAFRLFRMTTPLPDIKRDQLPTVSVCIPARNEKLVMTECLEKVLASSYPKLEIIVLDDNSADDTSALIKAFASEGVRFVESRDLPGDWIGKNRALQKLLEASSGDYVLFMDVDTRLAPDTIQKLVSYTLADGADMVSVLPRREDGWRWSAIFGTLRYFWELVMHSSLAPAAAGNAWMIKRSTLMDMNGLNDFRAVVQPESQLAARLMPAGKYRFLIGSPELGLSHEKKWRSQMHTSIRLLYPLLGGRIWSAAAALIGLLILLLPFVEVVDGLWAGWTVIQTVAAGILVIYMLIYGSFLKKNRAHSWFIGALFWPLVVMQEIVLLITSVERHIRKRVTWKGRRLQPVNTRIGRRLRL